MAIKGAVLGDILGSQYEFNRPKNLDWQNIPLIIDDKAKFTDDSVMMLAIKKALVEDNDLVETMVAVGQQYPFCGYGAKFFSWINGKKHQPYNSWGNGSAMRELLLWASSMRIMMKCKRWHLKLPKCLIIIRKESKELLLQQPVFGWQNTVSASRRYMITFCRNIR